MSAATTPAGGSLIIACDGFDVKTLDPDRQFEFAAAFVNLNTYDTLMPVKSPRDLTTFVPVLAKSVEISIRQLPPLRQLSFRFF